MDFYTLLGVDTAASTDDIKKAFRAKAFEHHPDANQAAAEHGDATRAQFQRILEAYEVLRDPVKRSQYDALRLAGYSEDGSASGPSGFPGTAHGAWGAGRGSSEEDWERAFDEWLHRQGMHDAEYDAEKDRIRQERMNARRRQAAEAWEEEKAAAVGQKLRSARVRQRAEDARHARQAAVLRRFWQGHSGITWQDAAVGAVFLAGSASLAYYWKRHIIGGRLQREEELDDAKEGAEHPLAAMGASAAQAPAPP